MKKIVILGAGWLGEPLALALQQEAYPLWCSTTSLKKVARLRTEGLDTHILKVTPKGIEGDSKSFFAANILVLSLPPGGRRDPEVEVNYPAKIAHIITAAQAGGIQQVLFTSSTGIYGEQEGVVNEGSPLLPVTNSGKALLKVEQQLQDAFGEGVTILRLAGLIGLNRQPGRWFAGRKDVGAGAQRVNWVHHADVLTAMQKVLTLEKWGEIINICGDEHPIKADVYPLAAQAIGLEPPSFTPFDQVEKGKVVDNDKSKQLLGLDYAHTRQYFEGINIKR